MTRFLGGLDPEQFLARCWQREPRYIPSAIDGFRSPLTKEALFELALREDVEARLVVRDASGNLEVEHGPFEGLDPSALSDRGWTLLVQDVDKLDSAVRPLLDQVRFIPRWRVDDVMVSYAVDGGTVGPHVDSYDVFLLQGLGRRRWQVSRRSFEEAESSRDTGLRTIRDFEAEEGWILEPGDVLYVPPGVAHYGVAEGESITYSLGFWAPTDRQLFARVADSLLERLAPEERFGDPARLPARHPGELEATDRRRLRGLVRRALEVDDRLLDRFVARAVSEGKPHLVPAPDHEPLAPEAIPAFLDRGGSLHPAPEARWVFVDFEDGCCFVYVDGEELEVPRAAAERLTSGEPVDASVLGRERLEELVATLAELIEAGYLIADFPAAPARDC